MKALAARRRHRLAPVVLVLLALLMTGGLYALLAPGSASAAAGDVDTAEGERLFATNCASCHGVQAQGTDVAPSLIGVGAAAVHFQVSTGRMPMAQNSPQVQAKPPQFNEEETRQMAGWVASLGPGPMIPTEAQVDPALGDAARGGELFRTNCAMCHNAVGAGGALSQGKEAPDLFNSSYTVVYEAMTTGPQSMPVFNNANIEPTGKRDIIAYLDAQRNTNPGGFSLGSVGPVSEGLWGWIVGIGGLIGAAVWIGAKSS